MLSIGTNKKNIDANITKFEGSVLPIKKPTIFNRCTALTLGLAAAALVISGIAIRTLGQSLEVPKPYIPDTNLANGMSPLPLTNWNPLSHWEQALLDTKIPPLTFQASQILAKKSEELIHNEKEFTCAILQNIPFDIYAKSFGGLEKSNEAIFNSSCDLTEIDREIKSLNFRDGDIQSLSSFFPLDEKSILVYSFNFSEDELRRRIALLSDEQVTGLIERFGNRAFLLDKNSTANSFIGILSNAQIERVISQLDFSRLDRLATMWIFPEAQFEKRVARLSNEQIMAIMAGAGDWLTHKKHILLNVIQPQQRAAYIQSIDFQGKDLEYDWHFSWLSREENRQLFTKQQVKDILENEHNRLLLSTKQIEEYLREVNVHTVKEDVLKDLFEKFGNVFKDLAVQQIDILKQRFGNWFKGLSNP